MGKPVRVAVCDDDEKDLQEILHFLKEEPCIANFPVLAVQRPSERSRGQSLWPGYSGQWNAWNDGYVAAVRLRSIQRKSLVIFLTNSMDYTLCWYGVAFRYLTKPIQPKQLHFALDSAICEIQANRFVFQMDGAARVTPVDEIYFLEVFNHHTILHTIDQSFTFRATLKEILLQFPPLCFGMPHQSYVVNFNHDATAKCTEILWTNGSHIPVSRRKKAEFAYQLYQSLGR